MSREAHPQGAQAPASQPSAEGSAEANPSSEAQLETFLDTIQKSSNGDFIEGEFTVLNTMGLHVRPATNLAMSADRFSGTDIWLVKDEVQVDAKTPLLILTLAGVVGTKYKLRARGPEAEQAIRALLGLAVRKFDVDGD